MLYETIMLSKSQLDCFLLFEKLSKLQKRDYRLSEIASLAHLSHAKLKYLLEKIAAIIREDNPEQAELYVKKTLDLQKTTVSLTHFRSALLFRHSIPFQFLIYYVRSFHPTVEEFLKTRFISHSTLNRNIQNLQHYLSNYHIHLSLTRCQLDGPSEYQIRRALYFLFWLGMKGSEELLEPFTIDETILPKLLDQFPSEEHYLAEKNLRLDLIIQYFRIKNGFPLDDALDFEPLYDGCTEFDLTLFAENQHLTLKQQRSEAQALYAQSLTTPFFSVSKDPIIRKRLDYYVKQFPSYLAFAETFLAYFEAEIFLTTLPEERLLPLLLNLAQVLNSTILHHGSSPNLHSFLFFQLKKAEGNWVYEKQIHDFFKKSEVLQFTELSSYFELIARVFKHLLQPFYMQIMNWTHLKVGFVSEPNAILFEKIRLFLSSVYFIQLEAFSPKYAESYDVVITTTGFFSQDFPDIPYLTWQISEEDEDLEYLVYHLMDLYRKKAGKLRFI